jgi:prevent-host-death family protein
MSPVGATQRENIFVTNVKKKARPPSSPNSDWRFSEAKSRFAHLFKLARTQGPQTITRKGKNVVIIAAEEYVRLTDTKPSQTLVDFFAQSPLVKTDIDLERTPDYGRELELFSGPNQRRTRRRAE